MGASEIVAWTIVSVIVLFVILGIVLPLILAAAVIDKIPDNLNIVPPSSPANSTPAESTPTPPAEQFTAKYRGLLSPFHNGKYVGTERSYVMSVS